MFSLFKKKKCEPTLAQQKLNKLWALYDNGELEKQNADIFVLCEYESGINGEGHSGFFFNNEAHLSDYHETLVRALPADLRDNFERAYQSYGTDAEDDTCDTADSYFYAHEQGLIDILQDYAHTLQ